VTEVAGISARVSADGTAEMVDDISAAGERAADAVEKSVSGAGKRGGKAAADGVEAPIPAAAAKIAGKLEKAIRGAGTTGGKQSAAEVESAFTGASSNIARKLGGALAVGGITKGLKDASDAAAHFNETVSKVGVVFGPAAADVQSFADSATAQFGLSEQAAMDAAATFGVFGKSAGLSGTDLAAFSTELAGLAGDMASFSDTTPEQAITAIGAALRGESEPIRSYGVLLDDATLSNRALEMGLIKTTKGALTPQQKVLAAHAEILAQTSIQQGDYARTSDSLSNTQKGLTNEIENLKITLGQSLEPAVRGIISVMSSLATTLGPVLGAAFGVLAPVVATLSSALTSMICVVSAHGPAFAVLAGFVGLVAIEMKRAQIATAAANVVIKAGAIAQKIATAATAAWTVAQRIFNAVMSANPIAIVIKLVMLLVGAILYAWNKTGSFGAAMALIWDGIKNVVSVAANAVMAVVRFVWDAISAITSLVWGVIVGIITGVWNIISATIRTVATIVVGVVSAAWNAGEIPHRHFGL
jgi:hypothetical protein